MNINQVPLSRSHKQGNLIGLGIADISAALGFQPEYETDDAKVDHYWSFEVDGEYCVVWDWKGSHMADRYSYFGPVEVMQKLFPNHVF